MLRPCFLVVDREHSGAISTRKLVIETAKFNVITAYSAAEALETIRAFPAITGMVVDSGIEDIPCPELIREIRAIHPRLIVIVVGGPGQDLCHGHDHFLDSFDPARLLELLRTLVPEKSAAILRQDTILAPTDEATGEDNQS